MSSKKTYLFIFLILSFIGSYAQVDGKQQKDTYLEENLFLNGILTDYYSGEILSGVSINASANGKTVAKGNTDGKGEFEMVLDYDKVYKVAFSRGGFITKTIIISTIGVPENKKRQCPDMEVEITLFQPNKCIKQDIMKKPVGKAVYYPKKNRIDWDMVYSGPLIRKLNQQLDDCAEQLAKEEEEEKRKEEEYKSVMKEADKAFTKKDWVNATSNYQAALNLFPKKSEPQQKLDLIATEIAKKAEAEKQRGEEKARAEAEALAKVEAEAAAKKAATEKLAKEKAATEVLAKANAEAEQKAKAEAAALLAEEERLAKEKAKTEAKAKKEAALKAQLKKEAAAKKIAEQNAKKQEATALKKMEEEKKGKLLAQEKVKKRAAAEEKALAAKKLAQERQEKERKAKELAAKKAVKAETERAANQEIIQQTNVKIEAQIKVDAAININTSDNNTETTTTKSEIKGKPSIKIKRKNPTRHLYEKPNKHKKGKGPKLKKRMVI